LQVEITLWINETQSVNTALWLDLTRWEMTCYHRLYLLILLRHEKTSHESAWRRSNRHRHCRYWYWTLGRGANTTESLGKIVFRSGTETLNEAMPGQR
jgi:hypothetical protein